VGFVIIPPALRISVDIPNIMLSAIDTFGGDLLGVLYFLPFSF
jgi:hypothetical protein